MGLRISMLGILALCLMVSSAIAESVLYCTDTESVRLSSCHLNPILATATAERARLAKAQADAQELKNAALQGRLLDAGAVEAILRSVRAGMLAVPSRAAQQLPHLTTHDISVIARRADRNCQLLAAVPWSGDKIPLAFGCQSPGRFWPSLIRHTFDVSFVAQFIKLNLHQVL